MLLCAVGHQKKVKCVTAVRLHQLPEPHGYCIGKPRTGAREHALPDPSQCGRRCLELGAAAKVDLRRVHHLATHQARHQLGRAGPHGAVLHIDQVAAIRLQRVARVQLGQGVAGQLFPKRFYDMLPNFQASDFDYIIFDMPAVSELIAHGKTVEEIEKAIGADWLVFQDLEDLIASCQEGTMIPMDFECSVFTGKYVTNDVSEEYLNQLEARRGESSKHDQEDDKPYYKNEENILALHNNE